ncbi:MAG TPA: Wzz/FepE/Etk N-terminal domain-containing protein [Blastocatellia bacterium]|nr:Wzz/FepE/Etk N-terminal domain-containing protein [Blastocatellia bacterium]
MASFRPRTLTEYVQIFWRRKGLILSVAVVILISTFFIISRVPDYYESRASVVVAGMQTDWQSVAPRVAAITERLTSRSFLETVVERHNLSSSNDSVAIEAAVGRVRKNIKVEPRYRGDRPEALVISYRNSDPAVAKAVTTDLVSLFGKMNDAIEKQMAEETSAINAEMGEVEGQLGQLTQQRTIASIRRSASGATSEIRAQRIAASSSAETLGDRVYALEQQIAEQKRQIAEQQKIVKVAPSDARAGSSYGVLLVRKAELEAQIKDFSAQYTDKNPKVITAHNQLAEINRQIAELSAGDQQGVALNSAEARELRSMQRELARLETELTVTRRELDRKKSVLSSTPAVGLGATSAPIASGDGGAVGEASFDEDRLRNRYEILLKKQEALERLRTAAAGLDPGLFQIVDMPSQPQLPVGPDRMKLRMFAMLAALAIGIIVAAAFEAPRLFSITDDRDVRYYLGAPVIALIPETLTPVERGRSRRLRLARGVILLLIGAALVPVFIVLFNYLQVFQILASRW